MLSCECAGQWFCGTGCGGPARVTTITGSSVLDGNDEYSPDRVIAVTSFENFTKKTIHTFPPVSVTIIEIPVANEHR